MKICRTALIGIGGFGAEHVKVMQKLVEEGSLQVAAFAEPNVGAHQESYDKLTALGAVHYIDYVQMLTQHPDIDFVVIVTPISSHKPMCIQVMRMGFHVLVEKPPAVTIQDLDEMIAVQMETGRLCQVNFQNTSGQAFRTLLERIGSGVLGQVEHVVGIGMWKRLRSYYDRTRWAGKLVSDGQYVLDGTFNNPFAHLLHHSLLAAGGGAADLYPESVQAELYHVNDIDGDDVSCIRAVMANGVSVHFYAMLCHEVSEVPSIAVYGTRGEAHWNYQNKLTIRAQDAEEDLAFGPTDLMCSMYLNLMKAIETPGNPLFSPLKASRSFVLVSNGAYESARAVRAIPGQFVTEREDGDSTVRLLPSLSEKMRDAAAKRQLYSEYPLPWAAPTRLFRMEGYSRFELPATMCTNNGRPTN
ncbi:Gfo/Idh/MocA family protein [Paenibacillus sp. PSB04]|uniref:Gfo/Idh/MocA family protein n=1 Tax=Paenibacillus sp. PSB04 TaxID=2866810 RepID=UPI0021F201C9|nr:Gfo/Idh/MocA family oxidoreductase [Paenibacillus sp. PSB04]UYO02534.1 Gfo/Idh/MocA family oxidoreductase [Paenibacillus sp. PSB04]